MLRLRGLNTAPQAWESMLESGLLSISQSISRCSAFPSQSLTHESSTDSRTFTSTGCTILTVSEIKQNGSVSQDDDDDDSEPTCAPPRKSRVSAPQVNAQFPRLSDSSTATTEKHCAPKERGIRSQGLRICATRMSLTSGFITWTHTRAVSSHRTTTSPLYKRDSATEPTLGISTRAQ